MFKKIYWPLDVDSTDHHHLTIVRVCYKCFFFLQRKKNKEMLISQKQTHLFHGE